MGCERIVTPGTPGSQLYKAIHARPFPLAQTAGQIHLRILATSDLHGQVLPYDYHADSPRDTIGLARTASLIRRARAGCANVLLFDNGDFLQGSPLGDRLAPEGPGPGAVHPMISAMNLLAYDAVTLGNHEFDHGSGFLFRSIASAAFPVISANALTADGTPVVEPYAVLERTVTDLAGGTHRLRIGVIGFLPAETEIWNRDRLEGRIRTPGIAATAARRLPELRAQGVDLVIALCHSGIAAAGSEGGGESAATYLAARPEVDVVLAGHTHQVFPGPAHAGLAGVDAVAGTLCGKPSVMPGSLGSHLGIIDLKLSRGPEQCGWRIAGSRSRAEAVARLDREGIARARVAARPEVAAAAAGHHEATREMLGEVLGRTAVPLTTHFALAGETSAGHLVAEAKRDFVRRAVAGTALEGLPVLATTPLFRGGGRGGPENFTSIAAGPIRLRHCAELYPFPDTVQALRVGGAQLCDWLERAASIFAGVPPGSEDVPLVDPATPGHRFFSLAGASYCIDAAAPPRHTADGRLRDPAASRIRNLRIGGVPVRADDQFILATGSFRAAQFRADSRLGIADPVLSSEQSCRDVIAAWVRARGLVPPPPASPWRLCLPQGASVLFETAPAARAAAAVLPGLAVEDLGLTVSGFRRLRLRRA